MDAPNPKRTHEEVSSPTLNPNSLPVAPSSKPSHMDLFSSTLLSYSDSTLLLPSPSSIDLVVEKALASASDDVSVQNGVMNHFLEVSSLLQESTKRCLRKRVSIHNSSSWPLPPELTIKAFSKLDTYSLMQAMVCCTMFHKYAMDSLCYSHINLTTSPNNVNNGVVSTMINRATKELRFLELGHVERPAITMPLLTVTCLFPLSHNQGFIGKCLRTLHLYNIPYMDAESSISGLSACSSLTDLKIVGLYSPCQHLLKSLTTNCRSIEHLFLETNHLIHFQEKDSSDLVEFLINIPNITSLTLIGFRLNDSTFQNLADSSRKLQYINLSRNQAIKGRFLRDSGRSFKEGPLKTLILRNCSCLEETEVVQFINSLSSGDFRFIRHIDVSNNSGFVCDGIISGYEPNLPLEKLKEKRPGVTFLANFPLASSERPRVCSEDGDDSNENDSLDDLNEDEDDLDDDEDDLSGDSNVDEDDPSDDYDEDDSSGDLDDDEDDLEGDEDDKDDLDEDEDDLHENESSSDLDQDEDYLDEDGDD